MPRGPEFTHYDPSYLIGREIHGQRIGIIGMGRIGYQVAQRATGFGMEILYHNRRPRTDLPEAFAARYASLDELLAESDFVVVTVPLTDQTRGMIGRAEIAKMRSTAILVNIARGGVVDTEALTEALIGRRIYAAGLDVTDPEPLPRDHPLLSCDNLTIAPHLGSATEQTRKAMADASIENLLRGLKDQSLLYEAK
jgi:glyoxylate reductase